MKYMVWFKGGPVDESVMIEALDFAHAAEEFSHSYDVSQAYDTQFRDGEVALCVATLEEPLLFREYMVRRVPVPAYVARCVMVKGVGEQHESTS